MVLPNLEERVSEEGSVQSVFGRPDGKALEGDGAQRLFVERIADKVAHQPVESYLLDGLSKGQVEEILDQERFAECGGGMGLVLAASAGLVSAICGCLGEEIVKIEVLVDEHQKMVWVLANQFGVEGLARAGKVDFGIILRFGGDI